jgi:TM2 domain-containing membrane protein YozV
MSCGARPMVATAFCHNCGNATTPLSEICVKCGAGLRAHEETTHSKLPDGISPKSRAVAAILAFILGVFGAHRFYLGKTESAVAMLILVLLGFATIIILVGILFLVVVTIWALVDFIIILVGSGTDSQGRPVQRWGD